jgi:transcriptional regulator with PAS, ATPase and Fis domain
VVSNNSIPPDLPSILFGQSAGRYGRRPPQAGLFEVADGGSVFFDEISTIRAEVRQALRVMQGRSFAAGATTGVGGRADHRRYERRSSDLGTQRSARISSTD